MHNNLAKSMDRAIRLMKTPYDYEKYISIKIKPVSGKCCCFHCWPKTWESINKHIAPFGPLEDEGDVLIAKEKEKYVLECHESGPEIILYNVMSGLIVVSIIELITFILKKLQDEDHKRPSSLKITKRCIIKGKVEEDEIIEISFPISADVIKKLNNNIKKTLEKK